MNKGPLTDHRSKLCVSVVHDLEDIRTKTMRSNSSSRQLIPHHPTLSNHQHNGNAFYFIADGVCMVCAVFKYNTIADLYQEMGIDIIDIIRTGIRQKLRASAVTECNELPGGLGICFCTFFLCYCKYH